MALVTLASIFAVSWAIENRELGSEERIALAVLPVLLRGVMILLVVAGVRRLDELQQRIQLDALAMAYPTAMMLGMLVEYLQKGRFAGGWTVGEIWPWMFLLYVLAYAFARWR